MDAAVFVNLLQVDGTRQIPTIQGCVHTFFDDMVLAFAMLKNAVYCATKQ